MVTKDKVDLWAAKSSLCLAVTLELHRELSGYCGKLTMRPQRQHQCRD